MKKKTLYEIINSLQEFWNKNNCIILQPLDIPIGAGTFHHKTFFSVLKKKKISIAYVQPSRRPKDGRYTKNSNRLQHYYQFQVILKPSPKKIQKLYLNSLEKIGIKIKENDIRFVEDNWNNPTLGAWGLGWEIWLNGMEISQFTYFQQMGGIDCFPATVEITYGLERIAMHIQEISSVYNIIWHRQNKVDITYSSLFSTFEKEHSYYNYEYSDTKLIFNLFNLHIKESLRLTESKKKVFIPAYEHMLYAIHYFNLIDCKQILSNTDRINYILKIRKQIKEIATKYLKHNYLKIKKEKNE